MREPVKLDWRVPKRPWEIFREQVESEYGGVEGYLARKRWMRWTSLQRPTATRQSKTTSTVSFEQPVELLRTVLKKKK